MGRVIFAARVENLSDLYAAQQGRITGEQVRFINLENALIDTGATILSLPLSLIKQLGLWKVRTRQARTTTGVADFDIYSGVKLTIQGRDCITDVAAIPDDCPPLIGVVPLELMDFVVDPSKQQLVGNPEHGGAHMLDMFHAH